MLLIDIDIDDQYEEDDQDEEEEGRKDDGRRDAVLKREPTHQRVVGINLS